MKKLYVLIVLLLLLLSKVVAVTDTAKVTPLPKLMKPSSITISGNDMIITDGPTVSIYQKQDLHLKKKFGKAGEGPQEFKITSYMEKGLIVDVQKDVLLITSVGKLSMYKRDGTYIKEMKAVHNYFGNRFLALKKGFVGICTAMTDKYYISLNLHDAQLNRGKQLWKWANPYQMGKGTDMLTQPIIFRTAGDKILVAGGMEFKIHVFDDSGTPLPPITLKRNKLKIPEEKKKTIINYFKTNPATKHVFNYIQPIRFPEFYPAVRTFISADEKVYIITHKKKNGHSECLIMNMEGKKLKQTYLPLVEVTPLEFYPFTISEGKLYQLVDNEGKEEWELRVYPI